jgi:hypothetical protein
MASKNNPLRDWIHCFPSGAITQVYRVYWGKFRVRLHASVGVSGTPFIDKVGFEASTSHLSASRPKMLGMSACVSKKISEQSIE